MTGSLTVGNNKIIIVAAPTTGTGAANKTLVQDQEIVISKLMTVNLDLNQNFISDAKEPQTSDSFLCCKC